MVKSSEMNLLFFFGVLIPALVTVALFAIFCFCWYRMRVRNEILYKKHDPHKIERLREIGKNYEPPPPPLPPFKSRTALLSDTYGHNNNNIKDKPTDDYEEQPEPTEGLDNPSMYRTNPDSGFSDLNQIQCHVHAGSPATNVQRRESDMCRPNSQASDDSDDSGFRSSRSGQYIHSASSSNGNAQDTGVLGIGVHSLQVQDSVPLFKPIKIHPNENGRQPIVSFMHRNSSKHKGQRKRLPLPSSQNLSHSESQTINSVTVASITQQQQQIQAMLAASTSMYNGHTSGPSCTSDIHYISKSSNDVHGGRLHSIDSHVRPLTYAGDYGFKSCVPSCGPRNKSVHINDHQLNSIGYSSDMSNFGQTVGNGLGYGEPLSFPGGSKMPLNGHNPVNSYIPGYNITSTSHMRPIQPEPTMYNAGHFSRTTSENPSQQLTITQAMVHKPFIEELSDPKLYSVV
ncbi:uncharacterized protein LOC128224571 [Mya arenaria]|uniref:uncharacterized protein LOC128224571 n=1 Tax=Mya arenaria TaxID=6604 RepID=UPI0022E04478|nr:uncharacterized protein LOC128224571 [Mya arenaria]XP_052790439.1 uncharacterized protein LOC128224571 [Mya arenaria]XP_052790447.1 uncharacterized protein LOC128224571 [Mya arenaria]XP_052790456.1 uncharacterized protein LOC128224571 [Mya arenaria]XP_052790465.1 uncharacterized protein LOC128224571 [Mya arenaria]XP_052790472.1 uncharacterized protein LOC128224571 [Mya arenaria]XP_052790480.1 uncharacterized protein LOC128224571 [Mya arenaria]XP_052790487.1 uncharacterized protein LOC1282